MTGLVQGTEAQILDSTQWTSLNLVPGSLALATDSALFFTRIGNTINQHSHGFNQIDPTGVDIGIDSAAATKHDTMDVNLIGLGEDYISDKSIFNCQLGDNSRTEDGNIKFVNGEISIYKNGGYRQILDSIRIRSDERNQLEYLPEGNVSYIDVHTGDSDDTDINNTSLIQEFHTTIGAIHTKVVISGGTF